MVKDMKHLGCLLNSPVALLGVPGSEHRGRGKGSRPAGREKIIYSCDLYNI